MSTVCLGKTKSLGPKRGNANLENYCAPLNENLMGTAYNHCAVPIKKDIFLAFSFSRLVCPRLATEWDLPHVFIYVLL